MVKDSQEAFADGPREQEAQASREAVVKVVIPRRRRASLSGKEAS